MPKSPKLKPGQRALGLVMILAVMLPVITTYVIASAYESEQQSQTLFITDDQTEFPAYDMGSTVYEDDWSYRTCQKSRQSLTYYNQTNYTPAFLGNDTWGFTVDGYSGVFNTAWAEILIDLPNLNDWLVEYILINLTLPGDADQDVAVTMGHHDIPLAFTTSQYSSDADQKTILDVATVNGATSLVGNTTVSLSEGLRIWNYAQTKPATDLQIIVFDSSGDGLSSWALEFKVEIVGKLQTQTSLTSWLEIGGIVSIVLMIPVVILGHDRWDIGGYRKDMPTYRQRTRKSSPRKKKRSGKRAGSWLIFGGVMASFLAVVGTTSAYTTGQWVENLHNQIDLIWIVAISLVVVMGITTATQKLSYFTAGLYVMASIGVALLSAPYTSLMMGDLGRTLWSGYDLTLLGVIAFVQICLVAYILGLMTYNLWRSKGQIAWP